MLENHVCATIQNAMNEAAGREICGFLLRTAGGVQQFILVTNHAAGPGCFWFPDLEAHRLMRYAARSSGRLEAFVHSHHTSSKLSALDRQKLRRSPLPWIVVVLVGDVLHYDVYAPPSALQ